MGFDITARKEGTVALVQVAGEIDMFTSPNLRDSLVPYFSKKISGIVVDLSKVTFMDSSGIATLVEGLQWSLREQRKFILAGPGKTVMNALSLTKLDTIFTIRPDHIQAVEEISRV